MSADQFFFNGVDPSGQYLTTLELNQVIELAREDYKQTPTETDKSITTLSHKRKKKHLGFGNTNLKSLTDARWGVIFAEGESDLVKQAIEPLIKHRTDQIKRARPDPPQNFCAPEFTYHPETSYRRFLADGGVSLGTGQVDKVPYYLLLVGDPTKIPYEFEYQIGSEYAVGRLSSETPAGYRSYVERLIDYETSKSVPTGKQALFWGTANEDDRATALSSQLLVKPLHDGLAGKFGFQTQLHLADQASKQALAQALSRERPPSFLFTASHGLGFRTPDAKQPKLQGALVTQDWVPGSPVTSNELFSSEDISTAVNVRGIVHFAFACYSAGTPKQDDFSYGKSAVAPIIAQSPFTADLPRQELEHGALAFIGHIERVWGYSFLNINNAPALTAFERAIESILTGIPIGHALRDQHDKAVYQSYELLEKMRNPQSIEPITLAELWKDRNDARAYALVGDPGARLRVQDMR